MAIPAAHVVEIVFEHPNLLYPTSALQRLEAIIAELGGSVVASTIDRFDDSDLDRYNLAYDVDDRLIPAEPV